MIRVTDTVKHLIIINVLFFIATYYFVDTNWMISTLSLHSVQSPLFKPWQVLSHMFMHGGFTHIFFNMFSLWMFGSALENLWGGKKFLTFYLLTGIGGALVYLLIKYFQIEYDLANTPKEILDVVMSQGADAIAVGKNFVDAKLGGLNSLINGQMLGASGAISGLLMAYGVLYPNAEFALIFLPIPIKAKYFIPLLIIYELSMEFTDFSWDNVAHLAHLSGMLIGFILIKLWKKKEYYNG